MNMKNRWMVLMALMGGMAQMLPLSAQQADYRSEVWSPDLGNGTYKNPVLFADYADPDVCRVGEDYYLTSSSFGSLPGLQILHSKDLVNWRFLTAAIPHTLQPEESPERPQHGKRRGLCHIRGKGRTENTCCRWIQPYLCPTLLRHTGFLRVRHGLRPWGD